MSRRICLLSDTHGYLDDRILQFAKDSDEIWHAGDFGDINVSDRLAALRPLRGVYGNIDGHVLRTVHPEHLFFEIEKVKVLMIHIAGPFGKYVPGVRELLDRLKPDVLVCGHSHILKVRHDEKRKILYMNPGAAGVQGFHTFRTLLLFAVSGDRVTDLQVVELGKRGALPAAQ
jgi:putative phosphoesterase